MRHLAAVAAASIALFAATQAPVAQAVKHAHHDPTVELSFPGGQAVGQELYAAGCEYDPAMGGVYVVVTAPTYLATSGAPVDATGCFDDASSFDIAGPGVYTVDAYQLDATGAFVLEAETTFSVA